MRVSIYSNEMRLKDWSIILPVDPYRGSKNDKKGNGFNHQL